MPKVSVIIPNYNHHDFLIQRIESVLNQTFQDFELILLDDASTDLSISVYKTYENHPKVSQVVFNEKNSGSVFKQWIKGIQLAKGDYVWIAESDDYSDKSFLEDTLKQMALKESLGMVFTETHKVDSVGNSLGLVSTSKKLLKSLTKEGGIINKTNFEKYLVSKMIIVNASSVLFKKEAFLDLDFNILDSFKNNGDAFVYVGIALKHDILFLPQVLNYMRLHVNSTTKKNKKNGLIYRDKLMMLDYYLEDFDQIVTEKKYVVEFLFGILFLSIDYGYTKELKSVVKRMHTKRFFNEKTNLTIKGVIFVACHIMVNGRPQFFRNRLKHILYSRLV